ncbi:MAG TPA: HD domain-containing phosphohydrolase [Selenomonadales bacterium]|nr:HD domain-containing phosphohydrolase [Selenomonadales bacterium]
MHLPDIERIILDIVSSRTPRGWMVIDRNCRVVYANQSVLELWAKKPEDILYKSLPDVLHNGRKKDIAGNYLCPAVETLETGTEFRESEVALPGRAGRSSVWCLANTYLHLDDDGRPGFVTANYVPIEKFKSMEKELSSINLHIIKAFAKAIGARDTNTKRHVENVSALMVGLAEHLHCSAEQTALAYLVGVIHDIGKIGIPEHILNKPGRLTKEEFDIMRRHPLIGAEILQEIDGFATISEVVKHHHERYDGSGYPSGLAGEDIPFLSRMLALCDSYDAMTSNRCYRSPLSVENTLEEIRRCSGTQFDPVVCCSFLSFVSIHKNLSRKYQGAHGHGAGRPAE